MARITPRGLLATGRIALTISNGLRIRSTHFLVCLDFGDPISLASHSRVSDNSLSNSSGVELFGGRLLERFGSG